MLYVLKWLLYLAIAFTFRQPHNVKHIVFEVVMNGMSRWVCMIPWISYATGSTDICIKTLSLNNCLGQQVSFDQTLRYESVVSTAVWTYKCHLTNFRSNDTYRSRHLFKDIVFVQISVLPVTYDIHEIKHAHVDIPFLKSKIMCFKICGCLNVKAMARYSNNFNTFNMTMPLVFRKQGRHIRLHAQVHHANTMHCALCAHSTIYVILLSHFCKLTHHTRIEIASFLH